MNKNDIHQIANLITEDPDLIENDEGIAITYTNSMGKTSQYSITYAWPRLSLASGEFIGYNVEWPNRTLGFLKLDGLSDESYELLQTQFGRGDDRDSRLLVHKYYARRRELQIERKRSKTPPSPQRRQVWNYMYKKYGRCCPSWHYQSHVATGSECWQSDETGKNLSSSAPNPNALTLVDGSYLDGQLSLKNSEGYWLVKLGSEQEESFSDSEDAVEWLENRLSPPDMEDLKAELNEERDNIRSSAQIAKRQASLDQPPEQHVPSIKVIESDYGPITITKSASGSIEISMEGEESVEFEDPSAASAFLRNELGVEYLIECRRRPSVLTEGIGPEDIKRILTELGYSNVEFLTPNENEFQRLDIFGGVFVNDKMYQLGDPMTDISEEQLKKAIAKIEAGKLRELSPEETEEVEDLQRDAHLFVIAAKKVGDKWVGITLMSLDDPALQFDMPNYQPDDGYQDDESAEEAMSVDDLDQMFNAPSFSPE